MNATALIVTHNRLEKLKQTLSATTSSGFHTVVIVNCDSTDGTSDYLNSIDDPIFHIIHSENIGGAGGFAKGAKYIVDHVETDWVVFYDDDAYPCDNFVEQLSQFNTDDYDGFSAHVHSRDELLPMMNRPVVGYPDTFTKLVNYIFNKNSAVISERHLDGKLYLVESTSFVGFTLKKDVLRQYINLIKPELFIYYDDAYFTRSLTKGNCKLAFSSELSFFHDVAEQSKLPPWKQYFLIRNFFVMKGLCTPAAFYPMLLLKFLKVVMSVMRSEKRSQSLKGIYLGMIDGVEGNYYRFKIPGIIKELNQKLLGKAL